MHTGTAAVQYHLHSQPSVLCKLEAATAYQLQRCASHDLMPMRLPLHDLSDGCTDSLAAREIARPQRFFRMTRRTGIGGDLKSRS